MQYGYLSLIVSSWGDEKYSKRANDIIKMMFNKMPKWELQTISYIRHLDDGETIWVTFNWGNPYWEIGN